MRTSLSLLLLLFAGALSAQERPQFIWQGEVDGTVILYVRDNRLTVQVKDGAPVEKQRYRIYDHLTQVQQNVRLEVNQGRGYVHIADQPRLENQYTLAVAIEDRQDGRSFYSISVYWDASNRFFEGGQSAAKRDQVVWNGRVDQATIVRCHAKSCVSDVTNGSPVADEHFKFSHPLPNVDVNVTLEHSDGRGDIRVVEQPRQQNNYTAGVAIRDPQSGAGEYSFVLAWTRPKGKETEPPVYVIQPGLTWRGTVDGVVRVTVHGSSSFSEVLQGRSIAGEKAEFLRPLPNHSDVKPMLKKLHGRGQVAVVEYPSESNRYTLVFEIKDPDDGADSYEIEVDW